MHAQTLKTAPQTEDELFLAMAAGFEGLSKQLKVIGHYVERHRGQLGIQSIQQVAQNCQVQPSAIVRFAKHFGFSGFSELQRLFREGLARQISPGRDYPSRIRGAIELGALNLQSTDIAHALMSGSIAAMQELQTTLSAPTFEAAVNLLFEADTVWLAATRRSFAVATYLAYALQHTQKRVQHITAMGSMQEGQLRGLQAQDVLVAISFAPYAEETESLVRQAHERGARIIAITDSSLSPLARLATAALLVNETSVFGFRALTNTMTVAQSLFMALAYRLELQYEPATVAVS